MLQIGVIGCGCHAQWAVMPAIRNSGCFQLVAVADPNPQTPQKIGDGSVHWYADARRMVEAEKLDAVFVATPVEAHAAMSRLALEAGCHVCCEKPMAMDRHECEAMIAAARQGNRVLAIDFECRYFPGYRQIRDWVAAGQIGAVKAVHVDHMWDGHKVFGPLSERRKGFLNRSGCLDCGVHMLDMIRFVCGGGNWQGVRALGEWFDESVQFPPHIAVQGRLDTGILATLNASFALTAYMGKRIQHHSFLVIGTRGLIRRETDPAGREMVCLYTDADTVSVPFEEAGHEKTIVPLLQDFAAALQGEPGPFGFARGEDGLAAQIAMDEANRTSGCHPVAETPKS
jgi:predicted dehydrogenase